MSAPASVFWQKNPALAWREIDDETIIISPNDSVMHELNDTGSFLWKNIDGRKSAAELAELLVENYEVAPDIALSDTQALLEEMASRKLLVTVPATRGVSP
ncbi:MAG TPA: PqqD family protein [Candidatus Dormibacteraeota bacterium]|nr:PqqD family protein [Candidatus Dormibacteraeota bacterium]